MRDSRIARTALWGGLAAVLMGIAVCGASNCTDGVQGTPFYLNRLAGSGNAIAIFLIAAGAVSCIIGAVCKAAGVWSDD